jgi:drug/metabolite transporter (DMT)-like permease
VLLVAIAWRNAIRVHRPDVPLLALAGVGDLGGNAFFVLANAQGPLSIAAVLSSLYPVTTVILAAVLLGERLTRLQLSGVVLALAGVVLISR